MSPSTQISKTRINNQIRTRQSNHISIPSIWRNLLANRHRQLLQPPTLNPDSKMKQLSSTQFWREPNSLLSESSTIHGQVEIRKRQSSDETESCWLLRESILQRRVQSIISINDKSITGIDKSCTVMWMDLRHARTRESIAQRKGGWYRGRGRR